MASLPEDTKMQIREYVGWPSRFRQSDSALEMALQYVDSDPVLQARITGSIMPAIENIYGRLTGSLCRLEFTKAGSIETNMYEIFMLRSEGRRHVNRLCSLMAIPVGEDIFSAYQEPRAHKNGFIRRG